MSSIRRKGENVSLRALRQDMRRGSKGTEKQKGHPFGWPLGLFDAWQCPTVFVSSWDSPLRGRRKRR